MGLEWLENKYMGMFIAIQVLNLYLMLIMLICRIHYTIDMVIGIIIAHYLFLISKKISRKLDTLAKKVFYWFTIKCIKNNKNCSFYE